MGIPFVMYNAIADLTISTDAAVDVLNKLDDNPAGMARVGDRTIYAADEPDVGDTIRITGTGTVTSGLAR
jgi:hypothetical protein